MGENCLCLSLTVLSADPALSCSRRRCSLNYCELKMDCVKSFKVSLFCKWSVAAIKGLGQHWQLHSLYSYILCMFYPFCRSPLRTNIQLEPAKATKVPNPCKTNWYSRGEEETDQLKLCVYSPIYNLQVHRTSTTDQTQLEKVNTSCFYSIIVGVF